MQADAIGSEGKVQKKKMGGLGQEKKSGGREKSGDIGQLVQ